MRGKVKMNWTLIVIILLNILGIGFIKLHDQNKYIKTKTGIEKHGNFAICEITLFSSGTIRQTGAIEITYQYKGQHYQGDIVGPYTQHVKEGDRYIVWFDTTNLKQCVVLFNCPVTDSLQFEQDVKLLKQNPPVPYYESLTWKCFRNKEKLW